VQKGAGVVSLVGEKLTEAQVEFAAGMVLNDVAGCNFVTAYGNMGDGNRLDPHYSLIVEFKQTPSEEETQTLADRFEAALCEVNIEYRERRCSNRLGPCALRPVPAGFVRDIRRRRHDTGIPDGQFKILRVTTDSFFSR
jgi:hypothetical protein